MSKKVYFLSLSIFLTSCQTDLLGNGEIGFKQSTSWSIYHNTEQTDKDDHSQSKLTIDTEWVSDPSIQSND